MKKLFVLLLFVSLNAFGFTQADFGAGYAGYYTIPNGTTRLVIYENGPGAGGGAGNSNSAGGGGGSGAKNIIHFTGTLGGRVLSLNIATGGLGGIPPGGNGRYPSGHTYVIFDNGWQWIAGAGNIGYGGNGQPGPGGVGGNIASVGNAPAYITSYGQFNLGSFNGGDGTARLWGTGGNNGDVGGGGNGGWWNSPGFEGQGGYIHIECYAE